MFTFNGTHADTYGVKVVKADRSPLPAVNNTLLEVPARNGAYFVRNKLQARDIQIDIKVAGTSEDDLRSKARAIGAWLYTTAPQALVFDDEPDRQYLAVVDTATLAETLKVGEGQIKFKCPMPYAEALTQKSVDVTLVFGTNVTQELTVTGTADPYPVVTLTFNGSVSTIVYSIDHPNGTPHKITINGSFVTGDTLVVDHAKGYVTVNGTNAMPMLTLDSEFAPLYRNDPANPNTAYIWFEGHDMTANIAWKERWL